MGEVPIKYATVGNIFYEPLIYNEKLYTISQGRSNSKDEKKVLEIDLENFKEQECKIEQLAMNSICVNENYIYTCNTLDGDSYII